MLRLTKVQNHYCVRQCIRRLTTYSSNNNERQKLLDRIIRVDHAGEYGANRIYAGQHAVLKNTSVGSIIQEMWDQEKVHLREFEDLMIKHSARPTVLLPFWNITGFALGAVTASLGKEAAMACTVAVEEVIGQHYNSQLRELMEDCPETHKELLETLKTFRDDELEHLNTGMEHNAEKAPVYSLLTEAIKFGCRTAIWMSERV